MCKGKRLEMVVIKSHHVACLCDQDNLLVPDIHIQSFPAHYTYTHPCSKPDHRFLKHERSSWNRLERWKGLVHGLEKTGGQFAIILILTFVYSSDSRKFIMTKNHRQKQVNDKFDFSIKNVSSKSHFNPTQIFILNHVSNSNDILRSLSTHITIPVI